MRLNSILQSITSQENPGAINNWQRRARLCGFLVLGMDNWRGVAKQQHWVEGPHSRLLTQISGRPFLWNVIFMNEPWLPRLNAADIRWFSPISLWMQKLEKREAPFSAHFYVPDFLSSNAEIITEMKGSVDSWHGRGRDSEYVDFNQSSGIVDRDTHSDNSPEPRGRVERCPQLYIRPVWKLA